jgi:hypothetical protein
MMKKLILVVISIWIFAFLTACRTYRVFVDLELEEIARTEFGFSDYYFFKIVSSETAKALTGVSYQNSGVIVGRQGAGERMIFVPKKTAQEPFLLNYPYLFSVSDIVQELSTLENDQGETFGDAYFSDYGGLSIGVEIFSEVVESLPDVSFDTQIVFTFTIWDNEQSVFHVLQSDGEMVVLSSTYERLN